MKKRYAAAIFAQRDYPGGVNIRDVPLAFWANSEEEAIGIALKHSRHEVFKPSDGWYGHQANVVEFPEENE